METEDRETGDRRQEAGDGRQKTGDRSGSAGSAVKGSWRHDRHRNERCTGPTLFDEIEAIIRDHGVDGSEASDGVRLFLE
jgi:hypothetical protein